MANGATEHLFHLLWQDPLLPSLHQSIRSLLVSAYSLQDLLWYGYQVLSSTQCLEVGVEGHLIHLGKNAAHLFSEALVTACLSIKRCN